MMNFSNTESLTQFRLWQLISPSLPIGGYAYSQGLEYAVETGWVTNEKEMYDWVTGIVSHMHQQLDVPVLARLYKAWSEEDIENVEYWNAFLLASRESSEFFLEDVQMGRALTVLLKDLDCNKSSLLDSDELALATVLSAASVEWKIPIEMLAQAYIWMWIENQVSAAIKLVPLGQTAGQRILFSSAENLTKVVEQALQVEDEDIGQSAMALAIASGCHEDQYTRIFRS